MVITSYYVIITDYYQLVHDCTFAVYYRACKLICSGDQICQTFVWEVWEEEVASDSEKDGQLENSRMWRAPGGR